MKMWIVNCKLNKIEINKEKILIDSDDDYEIISLHFNNQIHATYIGKKIE
jgi:hypothetical protein